MAANKQQGNYLTVFLCAFTGFVAGLVLWSAGDTGIGIVITLVSIALLLYSLVGFRKIKPLEFLD
jgi:CHASE2 domain-containing sensor protein